MMIVVAASTQLSGQLAKLISTLPGLKLEIQELNYPRTVYSNSCER